MPVTVVRYETKPDRADENQARVEAVFAELAATAPEGLRYLTVRLADGVTFVHMASVETADGANPLTAAAAFAEFQRELADRLLVGPIVQSATVVGSYGFPLAP